MNIETNRVVSLAYEVKTQEGKLVDTATVADPLTYLHGNNNLIPGLEAELVGKAQGDKFSVTIKPDDAYGEFNEALVQRVPADVFHSDEPLEVGMRFIADTDQGQLTVEITEVDGDEVVVDGNHMLAGETLVFDVEVTEVREATEQEIAQGFVGYEEEGDHDHDHSHDCCGGHGDDCCSSDKEEKAKDSCCGNGGCSNH